MTKVFTIHIVNKTQWSASNSLIGIYTTQEKAEKNAVEIMQRIFQTEVIEKHKHHYVGYYGLPIKKYYVNGDKTRWFEIGAYKLNAETHYGEEE